MSYGDSDVSKFLSPALSCVRQPTRELGARAVQIMLETIAEPDVTREHHVVLPTQLIIRETCAAKIAQPKKILKVEDIITQQ
jgi:LacI family transcriptional regulator